MRNLNYPEETPCVEEIYALVDVVVRCDAFLPLGRTLGEAYFAGCKVLAPYRETDDRSEIAHLIDRAIWLYRANDLSDMTTALERVLSIEMAPPVKCGNALEYAHAFQAIVCEKSEGTRGGC